MLYRAWDVQEGGVMDIIDNGPLGPDEDCWGDGDDVNTHRCGNVQVVRRVDPKCRYRDDWRIEIRNWRGEWVETYPVNRPWGYSGPGAAKRGAALMAAWQRGVTFR